MIRFIVRNNLYLMAALGVLVAAYVAVNWASMPVLQRMVGLFFIALVLHLWEEGRFPGGFVEMITEHLHFTASNRHFGEMVTAVLALLIAFVPLFFPNVPALAMAPMIIGVLEAVVHVAVIRIFRLKHFYSPGMVTAVVLLLPISVYSIAYAIRQGLMSPAFWLFAFLYMLFGLMVAQQIVIRTSGMKYTDFLKNLRSTVFGRRV